MISTPAVVTGHRTVAVERTALAAGERLYFLDNLRVALVMLVIAHHVGQAYGPTGGSWPIGEAARAALLGPFFMVNRSFFMSLFFMVSGYFTAMSYEASGAHDFVQSRLRRLGVPLLWWGLLMIVLQVLVFKSPAWPVDVGHLWFVEHLLIYSLVYALWRVIRDRRGRTEGRTLNPPGVLPVLGLALLIAVASGVVREWYPIDKWVYPLGFIRVMWADIPRDLALFIAGLLAYRHGWLRKFPTRTGMAWLATGLVLGAFWYAYDLGLTGKWLPYDGTAADVMRLLWEGVFCCAMCIGLTVLFREKVNVTGRLARSMSHGQYAAYIFHIFFVLACQLAVLGLPLPPLAKFALVTLAAIPLTFWFSSWVRKPLHL